MPAYVPCGSRRMLVVSYRIVQVLKALRAQPFKHVSPDSLPASPPPAAPVSSTSTANSSRAKAVQPESNVSPAASVVEHTVTERADAPPQRSRPEAAAAAPSAGASNVLRLTSEGKQVPIGNGGVGPNYWWTQTLQETTVYLDVASGTTSKDVVWRVSTSHVSLSLKSGTLLLEGDLGGAVRASECLWSLEV
jgi:hypothetical protein